MGKGSDCFQLYCDSLCICLPKLETLRLAVGERGFIFCTGVLKMKDGVFVRKEQRLSVFKIGY